ncbi:MAG TPA: GatB/YqeY domain-containing protein [Thermomicrobiales bacterium]|nr:GatB/YqeY domain-containing protein [Thermomicrobiales bacterium]
MEQPTIRSRLEADLKTAMRARDEATRDAIRYILAQLKNAEIEHRGNLAEADAEATLRRVGKQMADALDQFRAAGREDLAAREEGQLTVLRRYLPQEMSDAELAALVDDIVRETGAAGPKDMGKVMPIAIARAGGRADGRRLSASVKAALSAAT